MAARNATVADLPPEFDSVDSRDLTYWLAVAAERVPVKAWGTKASRAQAMLAAHMLKRAGLGESGSTGAPVSSESAGDVSVSYAIEATAAASDYGSTVYGREFDAMRRALFVGPIVSGSRPYVSMR